MTLRYRLARRRVTEGLGAHSKVLHNCSHECRFVIVSCGFEAKQSNPTSTSTYNLEEELTFETGF